MDYNMPSVPGIDWQQAHEYLPEKDILMMVLQEVTSTSRKMIEDLFTSRDVVAEEPSEEAFRDYRIRVHAMKSTLRSLGADLFADALALEEAAARQDAGPILGGTFPFAERYEALMQALSRLVEKSAGTPFEKDAFTDGIRTVREAMSAFDIVVMQKAMKNICEMDLPGELAAGVEHLTELCRDLDSEKVEEMCEMLLDQAEHLHS
ncbi:MAG: hypothetical protein K5891_01650 [Lachnospiraceae bacterium]|nr:hypothetical protein [Lachnospiraceae bacterium]